MRKLRVIDQNEYLQAQLLIQFMEVCSKGLVRPYDPATNYEKIMGIGKPRYRGDRTEIQPTPGDALALLNCCPPSTEVRDVKDLKPYIMATAERLAEIFDLDIKKEDNKRDDYRRDY